MNEMPHVQRCRRSHFSPGWKMLIVLKSRNCRRVVLCLNRGLPHGQAAHTWVLGSENAAGTLASTARQHLAMEPRGWCFPGLMHCQNIRHVILPLDRPILWGQRMQSVLPVLVLCLAGLPNSSCLLITMPRPILSMIISLLLSPQLPINNSFHRLGVIALRPSQRSTSLIHREVGERVCIMIFV